MPTFDSSSLHRCCRSRRRTAACAAPAGTPRSARRSASHTAPPAGTGNPIFFRTSFNCSGCESRRSPARGSGWTRVRLLQSDQQLQQNALARSAAPQNRRRFALRRRRGRFHSARVCLPNDLCRPFTSIGGAWVRCGIVVLTPRERTPGSASPASRRPR